MLPPPIPTFCCGLNAFAASATPLGKRYGSQLKQVYDTVYLPVAVALAEGLCAFAVDDSAVLRESLCIEAPLAGAQLRVVLEVLYNAALVLSQA